MDKVVILAAGLGRRMQGEDAAAKLSDRQAHVAETGVKALIPIVRPFLDYVLTSVADAGYRQICLVIGPQHDAMRRYYSDLSGGRLEFEFAVQHEALGTANALLSAAGFAGDDPFLMLNSDNYYPTSALKALRQLDGCGLVGFSRDGMTWGGSISPDRIAKFAAVETDETKHLVRIVEKPDARQAASLSGDVLISMNCWRFGPAIHTACRAIDRSPRGEYEIPDAVAYSIRRLGQRYRVIRSDEAVLDLSYRRDVKGVANRLQDMEVRL